MNIIDKINDLNPLEWISDEYIISKEESELKLNLIEDRFQVKIDDKIREFIINVNGKMFCDWVEYKGEEDVPVLDGKISDIGLFYSLKEDTDYDIISTKISNSDIILDTDILIAEATPGDFIVISCKKDDYGKVYFISHDFNEEEKSRYLIADSLNNFVESMYVIEDEE